MICVSSLAFGARRKKHIQETHERSRTVSDISCVLGDRYRLRWHPGQWMRASCRHVPTPVLSESLFALIAGETPALPLPLSIFRIVTTALLRFVVARWLEMDVFLNLLFQILQLLLRRMFEFLQFLGIGFFHFWRKIKTFD